MLTGRHPARLLGGFLLFAMLLAITGCGGGGGSAVTGTTVAGYVVTDAAGKLQLNPTQPDAATGRAVAGAVIAVAGAPQAWATSDVYGYFSLQNVPSGQQTFFISAAGCARVEFAALVNNNTLNTLSPLPASILPAPLYKWTVLVYMAANNDLTDQAIDDINQMENIGSTSEVKMLVEINRGAGNYEKQNSDFTGGHRLEVMRDASATPGAIHSIVLQNLGQIDSGNPSTLHDFLAWGQDYAPAEHYLLILSGYGRGWNWVDRGRSNTRALCYDFANNSVLKITDLPSALAGANHLDILACDAGMMSMLEVTYQLRHSADYFVGSENTMSSYHFAYQSILNTLTSPAGLAMAPKDFAVDMTNENNSYWAGKNSALSTCATLDLSRMEQVASALDGFGQRLLQVNGANAAALAQVRQQAAQAYLGAYPVAQDIDLTDYATQIGNTVPDTQLQTTANTLTSAIGQAVLASSIVPKNGVTPSLHGLSIYLPAPNDPTWASGLLSYPDLDLAKNTHWYQWWSSQQQ